MERCEYEVMYRSEDEHWWYSGLQDLVRSFAEARARGTNRPVILDAGCGTGKHLELLTGAGARALGLEFAEEAFAFLGLRGLDNVARGSVRHIPFADAAFDAVISTDVVCCLEPGPGTAAVREFSRVLKPGGSLLLNLPAYEFLRSRHDAAVHTRQRFTRSGLLRLLGEVGLRAQTATYRNSILFPVAAAVRLAQRAGGGGGVSGPTSDLSLPFGPINRLLKATLALENRWIRAGGRFPFGLSVFCVATKDRPVAQG